MSAYVYLCCNEMCKYRLKKGECRKEGIILDKEGICENFEKKKPKKDSSNQ